jgi:hypothetical protein
MAMKSIALIFLCLTGALSLIACAQPTPAEAKKEILEPVASAAAVTPIQPSAKEVAPMIDLDNPPRGPAIPAAELKKNSWFYCQLTKT